MNTVKTTLLLASLSAILLIAGELVGGRTGIVMALIVAGTLNLTAWLYSDKIALAAHRAIPLSEAEAPQLYALIRELAARAGLPMPRVYLIPEDQPNAFATGRDPQHAAVAVTRGLLQSMDPEELAGVLGHELAHVKHRDILIASVAATLATAITVIARIAGWVAFMGASRRRDNYAGMLILYLLAPIAALLIQLAISRSREYAADAEGARIAGNPIFLARALEKLGRYTRQIPMHTAQMETAHMMIANPLAGKQDILSALFSTHPPINKRIKRLLAMAEQEGSTL